MSHPFVWFLIFCTVVWGSILYFARGAIDHMSRQFSAHAKSYAPAYARGGALIAIAALSSFIEVFEKLSSDMAVNLPWWMWLAMFAKPVLSALTVFAAFLDTTVKRISDERKPPP